MKKWTDSLRFSCDWCNVRVDCEYIAVLLKDLADNVSGFDPVQLEQLPTGQNFYSTTLSYAPAGYSAITFSFSPDQQGVIATEWDPEIRAPYGILVSISGDGCRFLQNLTENGLYKFLSVCRGYKHFCTRLDMAMDIFDRNNPIVPLFQEFSKMAYDPEPGEGKIATRGRIFRNDGYVRYMPVFDRDERCYTDNVYIGDRTCSLGHCVVYNKKVEVRQGRLKAMADQIFDQVGMTDNYWYRVEYRAKVNNRRKELSLSEPAFCALLDMGAESAFYYIADNLFTFVDQKYDYSHLSMCSTVVVWAEFLAFLAQYQQNGHFVELSQEGYFYVEPSVLRCVAWLKRMASLVYRCDKLLERMPDYRDEIFKLGELRHNSDPRYRSFDHELQLMQEVS